MTKMQIEAIADRAAQMAVSTLDEDEKQFFTEMGQDPYQDYYGEYLDQLQTSDYQQLQTWLGWQVEEGVKEAAGILKMLFRARLQTVAGLVQGGGRGK